MTQTRETDSAEHSFNRQRGRRPTDGSPEVVGAAAQDAGFAGVGQIDRRFRRRPALIGLGVGLLAVCGAGAAYLTQLSSDTVQVLAIAQDVYRGQVIEESALAPARAAADPALDPVPADDLDHIVGQRAAADLVAGTLLTSTAVTAVTVPTAGQSVVGVAVTEAQLPQEEMIPGDSIRIFDTPNPGDNPPKDPPDSISATVLSVSGPTDTGQLIVDVVVDDRVAGALAARVATGRVAVVLDSAENDEDSRR